MAKVCPILWEAWWAINQEDLSDWQEYDVMGERIRVQRVESTLYAYWTKGFDVRIAMKGDDVVGILIYHKVFERVVAIRMLFVASDHRKGRVAYDIVDSISPKPQKIIFQTRKENPPERLLGFTAKRRTLIAEDEKLSTWMMDWERNENGSV